MTDVGGTRHLAREDPRSARSTAGQDVASLPARLSGFAAVNSGGLPLGLGRAGLRQLALSGRSGSDGGSGAGGMRGARRIAGGGAKKNCRRREGGKEASSSGRRRLRGPPRDRRGGGAGRVPAPRDAGTETGAARAAGRRAAMEFPDLGAHCSWAACQRLGEGRGPRGSAVARGGAPAVSAGRGAAG